MKAKTLGLGAVVALSSLPLSGKVAQASSCNNFASYIKLPRGECVNLTYLTILGVSRSKVKTAANEYSNAVSVSSYNPFTTISSSRLTPSTASNDSITYSNQLTPEARKQLEEYAGKKGGEYLTVAALNEKIENWAYRQQLRAMRKVAGTLATPRAEYMSISYKHNRR